MKNILLIIVSFSIAMLIGINAIAQVNISVGNTVTQDFSIGNDATATLPTGWKVDKNTTVRLVGSYSSASAATEQRSGNSMSNSAANGIYNFAAGDASSATDRAIGGLSSKSGSKSVNIYVQLKNNGSTDINSFTISYDIEKYRNGSNEAGFSIQMYYSTNGTDWTSAGSNFLTSFSKDSDNNGYNPAPGETKIVSSKTLNQALEVESLIYLAWNYSVTSGTTTSNAQALGIDNVSIYANGTPTPTIVLSPATLTGFTYDIGYGPSDEQTFSISGSNLTSNISLAAPTNYEISTSSGTGFTNSLTLNQSGGTVSNTTIYVRLKVGLNIGVYNGENITASSSGATSKTVSCSGEVSLAPVSNLSVICSSNTTAQIVWSEPESDYDGVVIAFRQSTNDPHSLSTTDPSSITANENFTSGTEFGSTTPYSFVVYKGIGNYVEVTGLTAGQTYKVKAYVYKGTTWIPDNKCPTLTISNLGLSNVSAFQNTDGDSNSQLSWVLPSVACFDEVLILARQTSNISFTPSGDGSGYSPNSVFGSGTNLGSNQYVVYKGTGTSMTISALTNNEKYYAKIFVRKGNEWSSGIELELNPKISSVLEHGDLAILAVNTTSDFGDEFSFVCFKDIVPGTAIDFTDNGYERVSAGKWGDTEGTIRLTRKNSNLSAGKVISLEIKQSGSSLGWGTQANIYIDGNLDNTNWSLESLNGLNQFDLNKEDQLWIMQNGNWVNLSSLHDAVYTGNVLYGWTATDWKTAPGYTSTSGSTIYPGCECATTNVTGLTYKTKVKYTGITTQADKFEWIARINNPANWTGFSSNEDYNAASPKFKPDGLSLDIIPIQGYEAKWRGYKSAGWCDCSNWYNLRVPDENTDVEISGHINGYFHLRLSANPDSLAICRNMIIRGNVFNAENAGLKIKGNLQLIDGILNFDANTINVDIAGDIIIDNINNFKVSKAKFTFDGSTNQNIFGNNTVRFYNIIVNKPTGELVLNKNIETNILNLTKGKITTGTNFVHITNTASSAINDGSTQSYINGNLRRNVITGNTYSMPVGTSSKYELAKMTINSNTGLTYLDAKFTEGFASEDLNISNLNLLVDGTLLQTLLDAGYWTIIPNSETSSINYDIGLFMRGATNAGMEAAQHSIVKRDNSSGEWTLEGNHANSSQNISGAVVYAFRDNLNSLSDFGIAKHNENILPIELINFNAINNKDFIELTWATASETNNDYFEIQKSKDAHSWNIIGKVQGAGFSSSEIKYNFDDKDPFSGINYFRLKQVDFDKKFEYSKIIQVNYSKIFDNNKLTIYPNPVKNIVNINIENNNSEFVKIEILDFMGRTVKSLNISDLKLNSNMELDLSELSSAIYLIKFQFENEVLFRKIEKQ